MSKKKRAKTGGRRPSLEVPPELTLGFIAQPVTGADWLSNSELIEGIARFDPRYTDLAIGKALGFSRTMVGYYRRYFKWSEAARERVKDYAAKLSPADLFALARFPPSPAIEGKLERLIDGERLRRPPPQKALIFYRELSERERDRSHKARKERDEALRELKTERERGDLRRFMSLGARLEAAEREIARQNAIIARQGASIGEEAARPKPVSIDQGAREDELRGSLHCRVKILDFERGLLQLVTKNREVLEGVIEKIAISHGAKRKEISLRGEDSARSIEGWLAAIVSARVKISKMPFEDMTIDTGGGEALDRLIDQILRESRRRAAYDELS